MGRKKTESETDHDKAAQLYQTAATLSILNGDPFAALAYRAAELNQRQQAQKPETKTKRGKK